MEVDPVNFNNLFKDQDDWELFNDLDKRIYEEVYSKNFQNKNEELNSIFYFHEMECTFIR